MTKFEATTTIAQPISTVYNYLKDLTNHEALMPNNVEHWTATADEAKFSIQNMIKLSLMASQRVENKSISIIPKEKAPIDLNLQWDLIATDEHNTTATFTINADLNMMLKMVASGPLQKLVDHQVKRLTEVLA